MPSMIALCSMSQKSSLAPLSLGHCKHVTVRVIILAVSESIPCVILGMNTQIIVFLPRDRDSWKTIIGHVRLMGNGDSFLAIRERSLFTGGGVGACIAQRLYRMQYSAISC